MHSSDLTGQPFLGDPLPEAAPGFAEACGDNFCAPESPASTAWRAEVAARVSNYRSRHSRRGDGPGSLPLNLAAGDGETAAGTAPSAKRREQSSYPVPAITECPPPPPESAGGAALEYASEFSISDLSPHALARLEELRQAAHSAFDTNYYRRANLESFPAAAEESADETLLPAVDLDLHAATPGNACLDRYYVAEAAAPPPAESLAAPQRDEWLPEPLDAPSQGNLIFFPRPLLEPPLMLKPSREELAEPVRQRPRILEVPEDILPAAQGSLFPEIRLDGEESEGDALREAEIAVPLPVAPLLARLQATLLDAAAVGAAGALFAAMAWRGLPGVPHTRPFWLAMAGVTMALWAVYQHLFLLYAGRTLGMALVGIELSTFDGETPGWRRRRRRARFLLISAASVMLGNLWALLDKDRLCWHDRLSHTFPTQRPWAEPESDAEQESEPEQEAE